MRIVISRQITREKCWRLAQIGNTRCYALFNCEEMVGLIADRGIGVLFCGWEFAELRSVEPDSRTLQAIAQAIARHMAANETETEVRMRCSDCKEDHCSHDNVIKIPAGVKRYKLWQTPGVCAIAGCDKIVNGTPLFTTIRHQSHCLCFCSRHYHEEAEAETMWQMGL